MKAAAGVAAAGMFGSVVSGEGPEQPVAKPVAAPPIDREKLVRRHNVVRTKSRAGSPLQVGNGNFAFGADVTGLQTFVPFNTMSQWGWYTAPLPAGQTVADMQASDWDSHGRPVPYESGDPAHPQITEWSFTNPGRINLGRIGMTLIKTDGTHAVETDLTDVRQELDLWTGTLASTFKLDGVDVVVSTGCHPDCDAVAASIVSPLIGSGRLTAFLDFPAPDTRQFAGPVGNFDHPADHKTTATVRPDRTDIVHDLGGDQLYHTSVRTGPMTVMSGPGDGGIRPPQLKIVTARYGATDEWLDVTAILSTAIKNDRLVITANNAAFGKDPAEKKVKHLEVTYSLDGHQRHVKIGENDDLSIGAPDTTHRFTFKPAPGAAGLKFVVAFHLQQATENPPSDAETFAACEKHWPTFWSTGGAIDLSQSKDDRWMELERRIVLSQYLMATNEAGDLPPQESGLVNTGWFGKFHMEMYWWHAAHYALWDRWPLLDRSSGVYGKFLPMSRLRAKKQGYRGARWTKMTGPDGRNAPYITNALLVWQQPHPMFFAELDYRARPTRATLDKWKTVLFETADFMASFAFHDEKRKQYVLGPPMAVVSENTDDRVTINPTFELGYWRFGLRIAQTWRKRLALPRDPDWDRVLGNLAPLPVEDGVYVTYEGIPNMWTKYNFEHPGLMGVLGWLPGDGVDPATFAATADRVFAKWNFNHVWGWDWPVLAMAMARIGNPAKAVDMLLTKAAAFQFDDAGLATGGPFPYFPSNGGLLYAVAMMAAGWDGSPQGRSAPGFPDPAKDGGQWVVLSEGLIKAV